MVGILFSALIYLIPLAAMASASPTSTEIGRFLLLPLAIGTVQ